jgi:hypothetical protein
MPAGRPPRAARYAPDVLVACPFCRDMFAPGERSQCPVCGVPLVPLDRLPPSADAIAEDGVPHQPEHDALPLWYLRRGRGALTLLAIAGLVLFLCPWVDVTMPDIVTYSGFALSRRLGWAWGAGVGWFILLPTVLSRRSIAQMRGARVAAAFLAAVPGVTAALLLLRPPHGAHGVPLRFTFGVALDATLVVSLAAIGFAVFFGGRVDDIRLRRGTSHGQLVH